MELPTAGHLEEGLPVVFGGIDIGRVQHLRQLHSGVRLELLIQRTDAPLHAGDRVAVVPLGTFGDETVVIMPGTGNDRPLRDGDTLQAAAPNAPSPVRDAFARGVMREVAKRWRPVESTKAAQIPPPARHP